MLRKIGPLAAGCVLLFLAGCGDVPQTATNYVAVSGTPTVRLAKPSTVDMGLTSSSVDLHNGSYWRIIGRCDQGEIYASDDEIVAVTRGNQRQAWPVVRAGLVVGFFLTVEKTFTPASTPVPFEIDTRK